MKASELFDEKNGDLLHKLRTKSDLIRHIGTRDSDNTANYCLMLGAGASYSSGIRTAGELINVWLIELYERFKKEEPKDIETAKNYFEKEHASWFNPLNSYSSLFEKKYDLPIQRRRFVENEVSGKLPSIGYAYLISLISKNFFNTVFTTNFDDLINEAFYQFSNNRPIICAHDSSIHSISITTKKPKIIKLHGDYLFDDIKSTLRETESLEQNTKEKLIEFCKEYGLIVVGYAGCDRSVMDILEFLAKQDNYLKNGIYWCLRPQDEVNQVLRNLLWKEKVYPVLIEGFDEIMADTHIELIGKGLDLTPNSRESRLQKIIKTILEDKHQLSKNKTIKNDIILIKNESNKQDISNFISDLDIGADGDYKLGLNDMRNLMEVDNLSSNGKLIEAYNLCEDFCSNTEFSEVKAKYILKLIALSEERNKTDLAMNWSNRLIDIDKRNISYRLRKASCFEDIREEHEYLLKTLSDFPNSYRLINRTAEIKFDIVKNKQIYDNKDIDNILSLYKKSLILEPGLSNEAWLEKFKVIKFKYKKNKNKEQLQSETREVVEKAKSINSEHINTIRLMRSNILLESSFKAVKETIDHTYELEKKLPLYLREDILNIIETIVSYLPETNNSSDFIEEYEKFYEKYIEDDEIKNNSLLLLSKSRYLFVYKRNYNEAVKYFNYALESSDLYKNIRSSLFLNKILDTNSISTIDSILEEKRFKITKVYYYKTKAEILLNKKQYEKSIDYYNKSFDSGMPIDSYLNKISYAMLNANKLTEIINIKENYIDYINSNESEIGPFIINHQFALKNKSKKLFNKVLLRNMIAHSKEIGEKICAFILLDQNKDASNLIKKQIEKDYLNYYFFKSWPIIPNDMLKEYEILN